jgi:hypothetical protein
MFINRVTFAALIVAVMGAVGIMADVSINNPVSGTRWVPGRPATVTWIEGEGGFDPDAEVTVELMRGDDPNNLDFVAVLGTAKETDGELSFTVPRDLEEDDNYAIRIGSRYSHYFTISSSATPTESTSTSTASPTPTESKKADEEEEEEGKNSTSTSTSSTPSHYSAKWCHRLQQPAICDGRLSTSFDSCGCDGNVGFLKAI